MKKLILIAAMVAPLMGCGYKIGYERIAATSVPLEVAKRRAAHASKIGNPAPPLKGDIYQATMNMYGWGLGIVKKESNEDE